jgi:hypothetical protein
MTPQATLTASIRLLTSLKGYRGSYAPQEDLNTPERIFWDSIDALIELFQTELDGEALPLGLEENGKPRFYEETIIALAEAVIGRQGK